ncbi:MAG: alpha-N-arabinofuranosidase, partial [Caulobacteraceae bacterium]|nr:alpha-N-arabinofuranosidase [Caulobacteraceae bacterium]
LAAGGALSVLMNNADRVKVACLAQLVNAIGAIRTEPGGPAWRQTIFHPFAQASRYAKGEVLNLRIDSPMVTCERQMTPPFGNPAGSPPITVSLLMTTVTYDAETGDAVVFALNRAVDQDMALTVELVGMGGDRVLADALELHHADLKAVNTKAAPDAVTPVAHADAGIAGKTLTATLKPLSWNVFVTRPARGS